jgi:hypothetical protein
MAGHANNWAVIPIVFIIALFSAVAIVINVMNPGLKARGLQQG